MTLNWLRSAEWACAILLTIVVLVLLAVRAHRAGGLWRDECAAVQLAEMPTMHEVLKNFQRESFPPIFPITVRFYAAIFGASDTAFRLFGLFVGVMLLLVAWVNARVLTGEPPLMLLALLGLNVTFLVWGTSIRGYGLGSITVLLAFGLIGKMLLEPTRSRILAAAFASIASVQFLLNNIVILAAVAVAVVTVSLIRRKWKPIAVMIAIYCACAISMLPYAAPFRNESQSTMIFRGPVDLGWFWEQLRGAFGTPTSLMTALWVGLFTVVMVGALARLYLLWSKKTLPEWDLLLYGSLASLASIVFYFAFLKFLSYRTRDWYYLALLAIVAGAIDLLVANLARIKWVRAARLVLATATLVLLPFAAWPKITQRQTNGDLVAKKLQEIAQPHDLIVINPWYLGVTFNRYYRGAASWVTCPVIADHRVHRVDLIKEKMMSPNPIDDLLELIRATLQSNNRVWFFGAMEMLPAGELPLSLPPAPASEFGWNSDAYADSWSQHLGLFMRKHALGGQIINVPADGSVNELENIPLWMAQGWRE